ncbi:MAG: ABC transporter substrate-binding protein [Peptococcales bacterium]
MFNKKKSFITVLIILLIMTILINGCQRKKEDNVETVYLSIITDSILYTPLYVALSQGFFEAEKLNIVYSTINSNQDLISSLDDGRSHIILAGPQISLLDYLQKKECNLINFAQLIQRDTSFLLSRKPVENFQWQNLQKGIIIGAIAHSTPQLVLEYLLIENQLPPFKKVDIIQNIPKEAAIGAFKAGIGQFIHLLEPEASLLEKEEDAYLAIALGEEVGDIAYTTFITKASTLSEQENLIESFSKAIYQAQLWCTYHTPEEITHVLKPFFPSLEESIILSIITRYQNQNVWSPNPVITQNSFNKMQEILLKSRVIPEQVPFEKIVDNSFAQKAIDEVPIPKKYLKDGERVGGKNKVEVKVEIPLTSFVR